MTVRLGVAAAANVAIVPEPNTLAWLLAGFEQIGIRAQRTWTTAVRVARAI
jgi:hypothetical protein